MDKEQDRQLVSRMDSVKTASDQLKEEVETVRKMKGPKGEQGDRGPKGESVIGKTTRREGFDGRTGTVGSCFIFSPTLLRMHTITFTFTRADSSRSKGRVKIITGQETYWILQAKTISSEKLMMTKDNQQRFYLTLGRNRDMLIRDEMDNFFENNKAFGIFQVCEANDIIVTNLSFTPVHIRFGYEFT